MAASQKQRRRELEFATRRSFIVENARKIIAAGNIEKISMDEIAEAVEYTRRTLYAYFKSRDEILLQVFAEDMSHRWALQREAITGIDSAAGKIRLWGETLHQYSRDYPSSVKLQAYWSYKGIDESKISAQLFNEFEALNDELADGLREIFALGVSDGTFRPNLDIDLCISQFLYSLRAVIHRALSPSYSFAQFDADAYVAHFLDLFIRAIVNTMEPS